jgi:hypothetical protein
LSGAAHQASGAASLKAAAIIEKRITTTASIENIPNADQLKNIISSI